MEYKEIKNTETISQPEYLNDFLENGWILLGTQEKDKKTDYTLGRENEQKQPYPEKYRKFVQAIIEVEKNRKY